MPSKKERNHYDLKEMENIKNAQKYYEQHGVVMF